MTRSENTNSILGIKRMSLHRSRDADSELRAYTRQMVKLYNGKHFFAVDEFCVNIWNTYFSNDKIYQADIEVLEILILILNNIGNSYSSKLLSNYLNMKRENKKIEKYKKIEAIITEEKRNEIRNLYDNEESTSKYCRDFTINFLRASEHYVKLCPSGEENVLDIGTGCGFLPYIFKKNGHSVSTVDLPKVPTDYDQSIKIFELQKDKFEIKKNTPFLKYDRKFDIITCTQICFNNHKTEDLWNSNDWRYFLRDLHENTLTKEGYVWLSFNYDNIQKENKLYELGLEDVHDLFEPFLDSDRSWLNAKLTKNDIEKI